MCTFVCPELQRIHNAGMDNIRKVRLDRVETSADPINLDLCHCGSVSPYLSPASGASKSNSEWLRSIDELLKRMLRLLSLIDL